MGPGGRHGKVSVMDHVMVSLVSHGEIMDLRSSWRVLYGVVDGEPSLIMAVNGFNMF